MGGSKGFKYGSRRDSRDAPEPSRERQQTEKGILGELPFEPFPGKRPFVSQTVANAVKTPRRRQTVSAVDSKEALSTAERAGRSGARRYLEAMRDGLVETVGEVVNPNRKPKSGK
jgi:hypothetical protein